MTKMTTKMTLAVSSCPTARFEDSLWSASTMRQARSALRSIPVHDGIVLSESLEATLRGDRVPHVIEVKKWLDQAERRKPLLWTSPPVQHEVASLLARLGPSD